MIYLLIKSKRSNLDKIQQTRAFHINPKLAEPPNKGLGICILTNVSDGSYA